MVLLLIINAYMSIIYLIQDAVTCDKPALYAESQRSLYNTELLPLLFYYYNTELMRCVYY